MKICPKCGHENRDRNKFCTYCAHDLTGIESVEESRKPLINKNKTEGLIKKGMLVVLAIIIVFLLVGFFYMYGSNLTNQDSIPILDSNNDTIDEIITHQDEEVKYKKVDFNGLFTMDVFDTCNFSEEIEPQYKSNYEWRDWGSYIDYGLVVYYYNNDQFNSIDDIVSELNDPGYSSNIELSSEGDVYMLYRDGDWPKVCVQSQDNEFVLIRGNDWDTIKTLANTIKFE